MDALARILRCRLMEKMAERPEYGKKLGLYVENIRSGTAAEVKEDKLSASEGRTSKSAQETDAGEKRHNYGR